ncbi:S-adenosyl-L-methionine-dependent methyltransferase [Rhexocercosporidium sp. MPI-PUGE-AT-0058]|nr:S-adenosyl-L-methionine-dependent methyltransferase [Rhexocercosporidium sp. MPI-PUGE-AT-0058]
MQTVIQDKDKWSANAGTYAKASTNLSNAPVEMLFEQMNHAYPFSTASAIMDVGSGPGNTMGRLIEKYGLELPSDARLIASDFSAGMIEQVQRSQQVKKDENPIWSRVEAKVLDAQILEDIRDESISHITGTMVYNLVANGRQALEAAHRVLQPGGIIGMTLGAGAEWMDLMGIAAKTVRGETGPTFRFPKDYGTPEGIRAEFETVGFRAEHVEVIESFMDVSNPKPLVDMFIRGKNPGALFFVGDYSEAELDVFVDEVLRLIEESHPNVPRQLRGLMIVAVGKKLG